MIWYIYVDLINTLINSKIVEFFKFSKQNCKNQCSTSPIFMRLTNGARCQISIGHSLLSMLPSYAKKRGRQNSQAIKFRDDKKPPTSKSPNKDCFLKSDVRGQALLISLIKFGFKYKVEFSYLKFNYLLKCSRRVIIW